MDRRSFLQAIGLAPFVAKVLPALLESPAIPAVPSIPTAVANSAGPLLMKGNSVYRYYKAVAAFKCGDLVFLDNGAVVGMALNDIPKDNYGFIQVSGPANVPTL